MLRSLLQVHLDGGASSNLPRVSEGVLVALRVLQRGDGHDALTWIYDEGPDELRVFTSNDFFPDGTPPEATGGYNNTQMVCSPSSIIFGNSRQISPVRMMSSNFPRCWPIPVPHESRWHLMKSP